MEKSKKFILIISFIILLGAIFGLVDYNRIKNDQYPLFCIKVHDELYNSETFLGIGYKIRREINVSPRQLLSESYSLTFESLVYKNKLETSGDDVIAPEREHKVNENINTIGLDINAKKEIVGNIIKEKVNKDFNIDEYIFDTAESGSETGTIKIYDFNFMIEGAKTNIGYTVFLSENENKIISIFDNMYGYKASELKDKYSKMISSKIKNLKESRITNIRKKALKVPVGYNYKRTITGEGKEFSITKEKLYYVILLLDTTITDNESDFTSQSAFDYKEEI